MKKPLQRYNKFRLFSFLDRMFGVFVAEFIHTTGGVNQLHLTGEEGMGGIGDFQLDQRVLFSVFPHDSVFRLNSRFGQKCGFIRHIFKNNRSVILWMNVFFHYFVSFKFKAAKVQLFLIRKRLPENF